MTLQWQDDSAMKSKFQHAYTTFNGWLIGGRANLEMGELGTHITDGQYSWFGGKSSGDKNDTVDQMWGVPGVGVFLTLQTQGGLIQLRKSPDAEQDYADVTPIGLEDNGADPLGRSFVDCGRHDIAGVNKRILLYLEYVTGGQDAKIWYSAEAVDSAAGDTWTELLSANADTIGHFHGAVYVKGKGLYVMTGDALDKSESILFINEDEVDGTSIGVGALINTPATWITRWGLGAPSTADGRTGVGSQLWEVNYKSDYVLGAIGQRWRTVDFVTADSRNAYYIPDHNAGSSRNPIYKIDLYDTTDSDAGTVTALVANGIPNVGWYGGSSKSGIVYLTTIPYWETTDWRADSNGFFEIWAIDSETDEVVKVKRIARQDYDPARGIEPADNSWGGLIVPLTEFGGAMFGVMSEDKFQMPDIGGPYTPQGSICGRVDKQKQTSDNVITVGSFPTGDMTGWIVGSTTNNISFSSGDVEIFATDEIEGITSGAKATVSSVTHVSGTWGGGDEAGSVHCVTDTIDGIFVPGEKLLVATVVSTAEIEGISTFEVIPDPTGQIGGNVVRVVRQSTALPFAGATNLYPSLSVGQKESLEGDFIDWACKIYIDNSSTDGIDFRIQTDPRPGKQLWFRREESDPTIKEDTWLDIDLATIAGKGATVHQYTFSPDADGNTGEYGLFYLTDFQLINGALSNSQIEQLQLTGGGGYRSRYS